MHCRNNILWPEKYLTDRNKWVLTCITENINCITARISDVSWHPIFFSIPRVTSLEDKAKTHNKEKLMLHAVFYIISFKKEMYCRPETDHVYIFNSEHKYGLPFRSSYRRTAVWKRHPSLCLNSKHTDKLFWSCNSTTVPCSYRDVLKGLKRTGRPFTYSSLLHSTSRWKRPPSPSQPKQLTVSSLSAIIYLLFLHVFFFFV